MHGFLIVGGKDALLLRSAVNKPPVSLQFETENLWTYFENLDHEGKIPSPEGLFDMALALWNNYSNPGAFTKFVIGHRPNDSIVPIGEPWRKEEDIDAEPAPNQVIDGGIDGEGGGELGEDEGKRETKKKDVTSAGDDEFVGDRTLARSASFMYEALVSKEVAQAVAEGDVGRVYEGIKVSFPLNHTAGF